MILTALLALAASDPVYASPEVLACDPTGRLLYVAEAGRKRVSVFELGEGAPRPLDAFEVPGRPTGLALSRDGSRLYVTSEHMVRELDALNGLYKRTLHMSGARAPVVSPDGSTLFVCSRYRNEVVVIDLAAGRERARTPAVREPMAADITPDGALLLVANHLPGGAADAEYVAAEVMVVDALSGELGECIPLPDGSTALKELRVTLDGRHALVTHILARYHHPTTQLERGWVNTNALSIIDLERIELLGTVLLDQPEQGAANPWGLDLTPDGRHAVVACSGSHALVVVDVAGTIAKLRALEPEERAAASDDLSFLGELRRRIELEGKGPRGLVIVGERAYVAEYFFDSIGIVELGTGEACSFPIAPDQPMTEASRGELLFHDATICFQEWQSCASCHPDGRVDGLNWDLQNDGFGNPKNTKSLTLSHLTPPAMALGVRPSAEAGVRAGLRHILFAERPEEEAAAIDAWLKNITPRKRWGQGANVQKGEILFAQAGCAACHPGPLYTDKESHRLVGGGLELDTPTLVEVWLSAPYLHDGSAATILDVLRECGEEDPHRKALELDESELEGLVEYVLSL